MSRRSFRKSLRLLLPVVVAGAVVLVPGVASASDDDPIGTVTSELQDAANQITGSGTDPSGAAQGATGSDPSPGGGLPGGLPGGLLGDAPGDDPSGGGNDPSSGLSPDALRALFIKAVEPLGVSGGCVIAVFDGFQNVLDALVNSGPQDLQNLLNQLVGALQNGGQGFDPTSLTDSDIAQALEGLATALLVKCVPAPPTGGTPPTPTPTPAPPAPAPVAPTPVAQPVSYPGYAPTGGVPDESSSPVPLAVLGGVVLLSGAGAAGYRMSTRAARPRG